MIRIALVDDHTLFRNGLKLLLSSNPEFEVVADVGSGEEFLSVVEQERPDVVFMDYSMSGMNGAQTTEQALQLLPELKVITLSMFGENSYYSHMVSVGAKGFLLKDSELAEVVEAVHAVMDGGSYFSRSLLESISLNMRSARLQSEVHEADVLSEREVEILVGICQGLSTQEIADKLCISKRTVDKHRANILEKSGCKNTAAMVVYAIRNNLVEL